MDANTTCSQKAPKLPLWPRSPPSAVAVRARWRPPCWSSGSGAPPCLRATPCVAPTRARTFRAAPPPSVLSYVRP
eukprot:5307938-Prymnesium_polylepis.1